MCKLAAVDPWKMGGYRWWVRSVEADSFAGRGLLTPLPTSEVRNTDTFGVLELTPNTSSYDWNFIPTSSGTFTESGTASCH